MTTSGDENEPWAVARATSEDESGPAPAVLLREDPESPPAKSTFDLEERTAKFGEAVIDFLKKIPVGPHTNRLIDQLTGSGTSVGANYCEADNAVSRKEFALKINTCRKEARESKFFIRMLARAVPQLATEARSLWTEAQALHRIFSRIRTTLQKEA